MRKSDIVDLRERAMQVLRTRKEQDFLPLLDDFEKLIEEHNIQKIELELQQEELLKSNHQLELQNKKLDDIFENAPIAYFILNDSGKIIQINKAGILLLNSHKVLGEELTRYISASSQDDYHLHHMQIKEQNRAANVEVSLNVWNPDTPCYCLLNSLPYFDPESKKWFYRVSATDITHARRSSQLMKEAKEKAEEANMAKTRFLANMSHEIRTPLNAILGFAEILKQFENHDESYQYYISGIEKSSKALIDLINDILDLSRSDAVKSNTKATEVNLKNLLLDVHQIYYLKIKDKGLQFHLHIEDDFPNCIFIDQVRLQQILINLLGNAIKFTPSGSISIKVNSEHINRIANNSWINLNIWIKDTGIGIKKENLGKIFEPFFQTDFAQQEGTGLGLPIAKRFVESMNGKIQAISTEGKGTEFHVYIPAVQVADCVTHVENEFNKNFAQTPKKHRNPFANLDNLMEEIDKEIQTANKNSTTFKILLNQEIWNLYQTKSQIIDFEEIKSFSNILFTFAESHKLQHIKRFALFLEEGANEFKVKEVQEGLKRLSLILEKWI